MRILNFERLRLIALPCSTCTSARPPNGRCAAPMPDKSRTDAATEHLAYAEASLMLVEGLMQVLLEKNLLTIQDLQAVIDSAVETKEGS